MTATTVTIDKDRLWASLMEMGSIGATAGGGVGRVALTDLDKQGRDLFVTWCRDAGLDVRVDYMGNILARRAGTDPDAAPVMMGSHLDSQPLGGKFDGAYGVLAGLEVIRALNDAGVQTTAPLELVNWSDEEGMRFRSGLVASAVFAGLYDLDYGLSMPDQGSDATFGSELARIGYAGEIPCGGFPVAAYFEAHIEQGPILENEGVPIGVVLGAQARRCFTATVTGEEGHAGTLPMPLRKDAMVGAARMIDGMSRLVYEMNAAPLPMITSGHMQIRPNSRNTIPGQVLFSIDARHPEEAVLTRLVDASIDRCREIADEAGLGFEIEETATHPAVSFHPDCIAAVRDAAKRVGVESFELYSGAGHDACNLASCAPSGMIFVPCLDGISHNEREHASPEDAAIGCQVLLEVMVAHAGLA